MQATREPRRTLRWVCVGGVAALLFPLLAAGASAKVTLSFLAGPRRTADGRDLNEQLVQTFSQTHPEIEVAYTPAADEWVTQTSVAMAAGAAPDVIAGWESFFRAWLEDGQALSLDPYFDAAYLRDFAPSHLRTFQVDGHQYALPHYTGVSGLFYNTDMFDQAGLTAPDSSWNWDTLLAAAKKLTKRSGDGQATQWGFDVELGWDRVIQFVWENGGRVIGEGNIVGDRLYLDEPAALGGLRFQHDLIWNHQVAPNWSRLGKSPWDSFWQGNVVAMWQTGSWDISSTMQNARAAWNVAARPRGPAARSAIHTTDGFMIYAGTKYPQEAATFLRFLTSPQAEEIMMLQGNLQPARRSLGLKYATETLAARRGYNVKVFVDQTAYARPAPFFSNQKAVNDILYPALDRIFWENAVPLETGVKQLTQQINAVLAEGKE